MSAKCWVVWLKDSRYSYAWGETAPEAEMNYLRDWAEGIARVEPADSYPSQLPPMAYVPTVSQGLKQTVPTEPKPLGKAMPAEWAE